MSWHNSLLDFVRSVDVVARIAVFAPSWFRLVLAHKRFEGCGLLRRTQVVWSMSIHAVVAVFAGDRLLPSFAQLGLRRDRCSASPSCWQQQRHVVALGVFEKANQADKALF